MNENPTNANEQFALGKEYLNKSEKTAENWEKAKIWFTKAAEQGHKNAQYYARQMSEEFVKKEIKNIIIGAIIGTVLFEALIFATSSSNMPTGADLLLYIFMGLWLGLGVGGNITFFPRLWGIGKEYFHSDGASIFLCVAGFMLFFIAGPIWPLIRILMKIHKTKKIKEFEVMLHS
jgi:hypothetical protein